MGSMVLMIKQMPNGISANVLLTSTSVKQKRKAPTSELSGVKSPVVTVTVEQSALDSATIFLDVLWAQPSELCCTLVTYKTTHPPLRFTLLVIFSRINFRLPKKK